MFIVDYDVLSLDNLSETAQSIAQQGQVTLYSNQNICVDICINLEHGTIAAKGASLLVCFSEIRGIGDLKAGMPGATFELDSTPSAYVIRQEQELCFFWNDPRVRSCAGNCLGRVTYSAFEFELSRFKRRILSDVRGAGTALLAFLEAKRMP